ncbi:ATP-dependent RNA helicase [Sorochytrium milnesiophthora]
MKRKSGSQGSGGGSGSKRKLQQKHKQPVTEELLNLNDVDSWGWSQSILNGDDELCGLEELDGVAVDFEETESGPRTIRVKRIGEKSQAPRTIDFDELAEQHKFIHVDGELPDDHGDSGQDPSLSSSGEDDASEDEMEEDAQPPAETTPMLLSLPAPTSQHAETGPRPDVQLPDINDLEGVAAWSTLLPGLHPQLLKGLSQNKFHTPIEIQTQCLPLALNRGRDIIGAAETGSGKTLAFGLPILQRICYSPLSKPHRLRGLILAPTRELALQIVVHLKSVSEPFSLSHRDNRINIVPIVGGLSEAKQRRLLSFGADIIVATPGRLWDLVESGLVSRQSLKQASFLVLDEADRMLERGKFAELDNVLGLLGSSSESNGKHSAKEEKRQVLVFSATLPSADAPEIKGKQVTFKELLERVRPENPVTIDLMPENRMAESLIESRIDCSSEEKDLLLYYLLCRYPGRTLVFVNSIATLRRLVPLLTHLKLPVYGLHAQMQQRQRLKNLDRFTANENSILLASDVAARGLDIKGVQHVIHFHVPVSTELYVHRSGRTARAAAEGLSIVLVSPQDVLAYRKICKTLGRKAIPEFPVDRSYFTSLRKRLVLAKRIDELTHGAQKAKHDNDWLSNAAEALGVDIDDHFVSQQSGEDMPSKAQITALTRQLNHMLGAAIIPKGISTKYITSGAVGGLPQTINKAVNKTMPTASNATALQDVKAKLSKVSGTLSRLRKRL